MRFLLWPRWWKLSPREYSRLSMESGLSKESPLPIVLVSACPRDHLLASRLCHHCWCQSVSGHVFSTFHTNNSSPKSWSWPKEALTSSSPLPTSSHQKIIHSHVLSRLDDVNLFSDSLCLSLSGLCHWSGQKLETIDDSGQRLLFTTFYSAIIEAQKQTLSLNTDGSIYYHCQWPKIINCFCTGCSPQKCPNVWESITSQLMALITKVGGFLKSLRNSFFVGHRKF